MMIMMMTMLMMMMTIMTMMTMIILMMMIMVMMKAFVMSMTMTLTMQKIIKMDVWGTNIMMIEMLMLTWQVNSLAKYIEARRAPDSDLTYSS